VNQQRHIIRHNQPTPIETGALIYIPLDSSIHQPQPLSPPFFSRIVLSTTMSGLPTPPMEDHKSYQSRKVSKSSKPVNRSSKRSNSLHEHTSVVIDGRHKRVWKACERCRMKKTKVWRYLLSLDFYLPLIQCDGESPCKRCKDDGLVCTAGSRKKTEFKQLPRG